MTSSCQPNEIVLTVEEALGLLDILLVCPQELTSPQRQAMHKLTAFCRSHLHKENAVSEVSPQEFADRTRTLYRLLCSLLDHVRAQSKSPCSHNA